MNYRRLLTRKPMTVVAVVVTAVLMAALVAIPAGAVIKMPAPPGGGAVLNSPTPLPAMLNYQGYLTSSSGTPITATVNMTFAIYNVASGGSPQWTETQPSVTVSNGLFNVLLGSVNPVQPGHLTGESYLGIQVGADAEMTPRQRLASVPYALRADKANDADTLDGLDSTDLMTGASSVKQLIHDFVVAYGQSVTAGDVVGFLNGYVQKGAVPPASVFNSDVTNYPSAAALSSTQFVVAYADGGNSYYGTAVIGDVSGNTITYGAEYVFNPAVSTASLSVAALSSTQFVVAYRDGGNANYGTAVIGDVAGNTITHGAEYVFNQGGTYYISVAALSSTRFVVAYRDGGNASYGTAVIGDVAGNTITYGAEYVFNPAGTDYPSAAALSSTQFVVAYADGGNSYYGTAVIGDVAGNTITYGSEYVFNPAGTSYLSAAALSSTQFVVAYMDVGNSSYGTAVIGDVAGNTITYGSEYVFNPAVINYPSAAALSSTQFVVAYRDVGNSYYGTAIIGNVSGYIITFPPIGIVYLIGIAKQSGTAGQTVGVIIGGVSDVHSGLTPGAIYYSEDSGALTTTATAYRIGLALSANEILLSLPPPSP